LYLHNSFKKKEKMFLKIGIAVFATFVLSCGSTEKLTQSTTTSETTTTTETTETVDPQKMIAEGYLLGTIVYSDKEGDCPYTIQMPGDKMEFYYLDPINLDEAYKKDGLKVWVKYTGLRRMNRCDKATPAEINDIKKGG
jgi:maltose-binding protein MalE